MMKFVNPKNDVAFRKIFGSEDKTNILIGFLNAVLNLKDEKAIKTVQILNPYQTPKLEKLKTTILDVRATDKRGITFIVEMQIAYTAGIRKRFTYYTAKGYASQIERGEDYPKLNQVIFIGVLDFILFTSKTATENYLSRHQILDTVTHQQEFKDLEMNFIELPKFNKNENEVQSLVEKWIYFIKNADDLEVIPQHVNDSALQNAYESANRFTWSKEDLDAYEYRGMRIQDERGAIEHAHKKGHEQGHRKGHEEGHKKGYEEGRLETAQKMKAKGYNATEIAELTGLPLDKVKDL